MRTHSQYRTVEVWGRGHVVCDYPTFRGTKHPQPNYQKTGMALCGVLKKNETLEHWIKRTKK
jgi:hypothetical protein